MKITNVINDLEVNPNAKPWKKKRFIRRIVIHHSKTENQGVADFNRHHINFKRWYRISYIYVLDDVGNVFKCNEDNDYTYHCAGANYDSIGICLEGNFDKKEVPKYQMDALVELLAELVELYQIGPDGIVGHRNFKTDASYTCPGKNVIIEKIRENVREWMKNTPASGLVSKD